MQNRHRHDHRVSWLRSLHAWVVITIALSVCATAWAGSPNTANRREIKQRAFDGLKAAVTYEYNPGIRVAAVEAMEAAETEDALPWIRLALRDDYPAVRFAACLAVARLKDKTSLETVQSLIRDKDANVQVAALLACHALGDDAKTAKMPPYLLDHEDVAVRRNAAMVFGLFDSEGAVKILARAMSDKDNGVREYALEALARHRNPEGEQELVFMTNTGVGSDEVFAINALATTRDKKYRDTYLYKLSTGTHLETQLAAARALGMLGASEGKALALRSLQSPTVRDNDMNDPPSSQIVRAKVIAAAALGAIGHVDSIGPLRTMLEDSGDPRLQVAAARAILEVLRANADPGLPFGK